MKRTLSPSGRLYGSDFFLMPVDFVFLDGLFRARLARGAGGDGDLNMR